MSADKLKILLFVSYYKPGFKAGGTLRTVSNLVDALADRFDFYLLTRDRDLGDEKPYSAILRNTWVKVNNANVMYLSPEQQSFASIKRLMKTLPFDLIYVNSFFDKSFSLYPVLCWQYFLRCSRPLIVAPKGEFASSALALKSFKKLVYLHAYKRLIKTNRLHWHASCLHESKDIQSALALLDKQVSLACDLPTVQEKPVKFEKNQTAKRLKLVFLARINPVKNLDYALEILQSVSCPLDLDIYGPIEDKQYWNDCMRIIQTLPMHCNVQYKGPVSSEKVQNVLSQYDLLFFPSRGENYGHVIIEALTVGTPVLISDKTPWLDLEEKGLGWVFPLSDTAPFVACLENFARHKAIDGNEQREIMISKISDYLNVPEVIQQNTVLFKKAYSDVQSSGSSHERVL